MNTLIKTAIMKRSGKLLLAACVWLHSAAPAWALPDVGSMEVDSGAASYDYTSGAPQGTITFVENNSMVTFAEAVNINAGETLNVVPGAAGNGSWVGVIRDNSGVASQLDGTLAQSMQLFFLNANGIVTGNGFSVDFSGLTNATGGLVLSTSTLDQTALGNGLYQLSSPANGASVVLNGLQVNGEGAAVVALADQVAINGAVQVPQGQFHAISAGEVDVTFGVSDLIAIKSPVSAAQAGITAAASADINAGDVTLQAWVSDPLSLALNNQGMVSATGISVTEQGTIRLVGRGGTALNLGTLDASDPSNGDGSIELQGNTVVLGGVLEAASVQVNVGDAQAGTDGELLVVGNASVNAASAVINGLGENNTIDGLANYRVTQQNAGTAGWQGVDSSDWSNSGATMFDNISRLIARGDVDNDLRIEEGGSLFNADGTALLRGGVRSDTFTIAGTGQLIEGVGGDDTFIMDGGRVDGLVDGGGGIDSIENVFNATRSGPRDLNGSSDFVDWVNIQNVIPAFVPVPIPLPEPELELDSVIAPQLSFANVSAMSAASLGLVGDGAEPRLPCGFGSAPIALAKEEPCMRDFNAPEYQALISSLIHFDNDSSAITPASATRLDKVADFFIESQVFNKVVIAAHTDDNASEAYNLALSERRALSTSSYMQQRGVRNDFIETFHFGEVLPAVPNTSAANRAYNRRARIELKQ